MKLARALVLVVLIGILGVGMFEACRNKGRIAIHGQAGEADQIVVLKLTVRNLDSSAVLSKLSIQVETDKFWNFISVDEPLNVSARTDIYGPKSQWACITIDLGDSRKLKPRENIEFRVKFSRGVASTNVLEGNVSYLGAVIWEKVGAGQRNAEYFRIPVGKAL